MLSHFSCCYTFAVVKWSQSIQPTGVGRWRWRRADGGMSTCHWAASNVSVSKSSGAGLTPACSVQFGGVLFGEREKRTFLPCKSFCCEFFQPSSLTDFYIFFQGVKHIERRQRGWKHNIHRRFTCLTEILKLQWFSSDHFHICFCWEQCFCHAKRKGGDTLENDLWTAPLCHLSHTQDAHTYN